MGKVNVEASEYIQSNGVRVEARAIESYETTEWVVVNNQRIQQRVRKENALYSRDENVSGPSDFGQGPTRSFPFSVGIPPCRPTHGGSVTYNVKGVLAIKGRPDATANTQIAFGPPQPQGYPMMPPQMQPVGYGPPPMYGPAGYPPQGYAPQGYGPAPGYGQPQPYGAQYPQYAPPQPGTSPAAKTRCKYCQSMMDQGAGVCPNCGAHQ